MLTTHHNGYQSACIIAKQNIIKKDKIDVWSKEVELEL